MHSHTIYSALCENFTHLHIGRILVNFTLALSGWEPGASNNPSCNFGLTASVRASRLQPQCKMCTNAVDRLQSWLE
eukprot:1228046-Amphidinium_carterae.2